MRLVFTYMYGERPIHLQLANTLSVPTQGLRQYPHYKIPQLTIDVTLIWMARRLWRIGSIFHKMVHSYACVRENDCITGSRDSSITG